MQSKLVSFISVNHRPRRLLLMAMGLVSLTLGGGKVSHAADNPVTLSLSPSATTAGAGSITTFTVNLTNGTNLGVFDFNIILDPTQLSFAGPPYFANSSSDGFPTQLMNSLVNSKDLEVAFGQDTNSTTGVENTGKTLNLGTFQVKVLQALPSSGTAISFGAYNNPQGASGGGSEVLNRDTQANELQATSGALLTPPAAIPEASQGTAFGLCLLCLGGLAFRARRRMVQKSD